MIEAFFIFLMKVLTVIIYVGFLILPFYLVGAFLYGFWHRYLSSPKRRTSISA